LLLAPSESLIIEVAWTLVHEMNFYLLFALMLWTRSPLGCLLGVSGLLLLQAGLAGYAPDLALKQYLARPILLEFCFGMALGYAYLRGLVPKQIPWAFPAAALGLMIFAPLFIAHKSTGGLDADDRVWAWGVPAVVLVASCINWSIAHGVVSRTWILLGDASYAIYLLHPFVMLAYEKALTSGTLLHALQIPFILAATILSAMLGAAAHVILERPITKAARRLLLLEQARTR
jgi:peptidoglycan/LPS O-acetylase OafA/YrhL